jgi:putative ABC transport system substrate-binding protein
VTNLGRPSGNLTGVTFMAIELMPKRLELLSELVAGAGAMALLINPNSPNAERIIKEIQEAARTRGVNIHVLKASTEAEIDAAFAGIGELRSSALLIGADVFFNTRRDQIVALAAGRAVPTIYDNREFTAVGGLISYGPSVRAAYTTAGEYVGRILKGAKPADLPVQQSVILELVINMNTAGALGLTIPQSLLARADEVIE